MTWLCTAVTCVAGYVLWRIGPDWREHYAGIAYDILSGRNKP